MRQAIQPEEFQRRTFKVQAMPVTSDNIDQIATWCKGTVLQKDGVPFIKVNVNRPQNERQTQAFVGDWVVSAKGFKVYTDSAFRASFERSKKTVPNQSSGQVQQDTDISDYGSLPGYESTMIGSNCD